MSEIQEMTMAQDNTMTLRQWLRWRRRFPDKWGHLHLERVQYLLQQREYYRSDKPMTVWVLDEGSAGSTIFDNEDEFKSYIEEFYDDDCPPDWHTETMTGREYGNLAIND